MTVTPDPLPGDTPEERKKIADLLALPNSEDVELDIDRIRELPRGADLS